MNARAFGHALAIYERAEGAVIQQHQLDAIPDEGAMPGRDASQTFWQRQGALRTGRAPDDDGLRSDRVCVSTEQHVGGSRTCFSAATQGLSQDGLSLQLVKCAP